MDSTGFMILGFAVAFSVIFLHLGSLVMRSRNLERDLTYLEQFTKKSHKKKATGRKRKK